MFGERQRKRRLLAGVRIEPHHLVAAPVIGNPELAVLVLDRAPRAHAVVRREIVLDVNDVHRGRAYRAHERFVLRQFFRRAGLRRDFAEQRVEIGCEVFDPSVVQAAAFQHHVAHVAHTRAPAVEIERLRRHPFLERMAGLEAGGEERVLVAQVVVRRLGQELAALIGRQIAPAHGRLLQRKVERSRRVGGERDASARLALVPDRLDCEPCRSRPAGCRCDSAPAYRRARAPSCGSSGFRPPRRRP